MAKPNVVLITNDAFRSRELPRQDQPANSHGRLKCHLQAFDVAVKLPTSPGVSANPAMMENQGQEARMRGTRNGTMTSSTIHPTLRVSLLDRSREVDSSPLISILREQSSFFRSTCTS